MRLCSDRFEIGGARKGVRCAMSYQTACKADKRLPAVKAEHV